MKTWAVFLVLVAVGCMTAESHPVEPPRRGADVASRQSCYPLEIGDVVADTVNARCDRVCNNVAGGLTCVDPQGITHYCTDCGP